MTFRKKATGAAVGVAVGLATALTAIGGAAAGNATSVHQLLKTYERELNAANTEAITGLYTADGVFMPQYKPSAVGREAVRQAYNAVFTAIHLNIEFNVVEVEQIADDWAFARTNSAGTVTVQADGAKIGTSAQELFVLKKNAEGSWKIARYAFSSTKPPRQ